MLGDAYFQLRAQIGTGLFSLLRLAAEAGAAEDSQVVLQGMQARLRESFLLAAIGPVGAGKSTLLNTLFEREFAGPVEPVAAGKIAVFEHGDEARDVSISADSAELQRPQIFLRDFTIVEAPPSADVEALAPLLARADLVFYVVSAASVPPEIWPHLARLGRDLLKRLVFVVWQFDRVSPEEGANVVKRLRQAMLKNLAQACPIFTGSTADRAGRGKLEHWIESEVILSEPRRTRLREIGDVAREALKEIVTPPRTEQQVLARELEKVRARRADLDEHTEQSQRQIAGALWTLAQSFDGLRLRGEELLRGLFSPLDLLRKRSIPLEDFAREVETQARASLATQLHAQLIALESNLREGATEFFREDRAGVSQAAPANIPDFPRASLEETLLSLDVPLDAARRVGNDFSAAVGTLRLPALAALAALVAAVGAAVARLPSEFLAVLAGGSVLLVVLLAVLLRRNVIARFGRHFTGNRAALLAALEPALRAAAERFYATLVPPLESRAAELTAEQQRHEPLLKRLQQLEETFARFETDLQTGLTRSEATSEP